MSEGDGLEFDAIVDVDCCRVGDFFPSIGSDTGQNRRELQAYFS